MASTSVKSVIGEVRFSYLHVFQPHKMDGESDDKLQYSAVILIPKTNTKLVADVRSAIKKAYDAAINEKWGGKAPKEGYWYDPLQDGDTPNKNGDERGEAYAGHYFISCKSKTQPEVVDRHRQEIVSSEEFYSGCYGYVSVAFCGYTFNQSKGISCYLNNIMKSRDGEPLGGARTDAASDFAGINLDDDDEM